MTLTGPKENPLSSSSPPLQPLTGFLSDLKCDKLLTALNKANKPGS